MVLKRLIAAYVDLAISALIGSVIISMFSINTSFGERGYTIAIFICSLIEVAFFILRDAFKLSIGKRLFKLVVYQYGGSIKATKKQLIIRNITICVCPIEVIAMAIAKDGRRIGDKLAKTAVDVNRSSPLFK